MKQFLIGSYAPEGEPSIFGVELDEEKQKLRLLWEDGQVQNPSFLLRMYQKSAAFPFKEKRRFLHGNGLTE